MSENTKDKAQLTYTNEEGREVKTSQFLRNRGSCCKTSCLHCPYGFTIKNNEIKSYDVGYDDIEQAQAILDANQEKPSGSGIAASLMGSAFGGSKSNQAIILNAMNFDSYAFVEIKGVTFGLIEKGTPQAKNLYLKTHFKDQGIDLDIVNSSL